MQALVNTRYGSPDRLEVQEIERPAVGPDGVLVRVRASSVNPYDWHVLRGEPYLVHLTEGLRRPKQVVRGVDVAGVVEAVGPEVTELAPGDEVFGGRAGAMADYVLGRVRHFVPKPDAISFEQAAAVSIAGQTALQALRDRGKLREGQSVLINGAAGGVGTFAVQIAKAYGGNVTGVCSTRNVELVRSLGADHVVDYTAEDFSRTGRRYDLILDNVGNRPLRAFRAALEPKGTLVVVGGRPGNWIGPMLPPLKALTVSPFVGQRLLPMLATQNRDDLLVLKELIESGKVTPVVDRTYPLREAAEAFRYVEAGHAPGKVVIRIEN
jgi:NADPH:quinone reductase-like Zn-dependent oxidoreductase